MLHVLLIPVAGKCAQTLIIFVIATRPNKQHPLYYDSDALGTEQRVVIVFCLRGGGGGCIS